jgi:hypothetical protein
VVNFDVVMKWMEYIRNNPDAAHRFSENFWPSQIESKKWLLEHISHTDKSIVIFGGWYGVLAQFIAHKFPDAQIVTTDVDHGCKKVFAAIDKCYHDIVFRQHDMQKGMPLNIHPDLVINTSSEHVIQEVYDAWWDSIPSATKYIVQGNNLVNPEHVRIADNLEEFLKLNRIEEPEYAGMLKCGNYYRYMAVGYR